MVKAKSVETRIARAQLGAALRAWRQRHGLTQTEVGRRLQAGSTDGSRKVTVNRMEAGGSASDLLYERAAELIAPDRSDLPHVDVPRERAAAVAAARIFDAHGVPEAPDGCGFYWRLGYYEGMRAAGGAK